MIIFLTGGSKSGKSSYAEELAVRLASGCGSRTKEPLYNGSATQPKRLYYVATMIPCDSEDRARIARHVQNRAGKGFQTLEVSRAVETCLSLAEPDATFLLDSVTALLLNELYPNPESETPDPDAVSRCEAGLLSLAKNAANAVFVADFLYSDAIRYDRFTETYRASLARLSLTLARVSDTVIEFCAGLPFFHKGGLPQ